MSSADAVVGRSARCERTIWNASPSRMYCFARSTPRTYSNRPGERRVRPPVPLRPASSRVSGPSSRSADLDRVAAQDLGHPQHVVEPDERVGDDEPALGKAGPVSGSGTVGSSFAM